MYECSDGSGWVGIGQLPYVVGRIGLGFENWTREHIWTDHSASFSIGCINQEIDITGSVFTT